MTRDQAIATASIPLSDAYAVLLGLSGHSVEEAARAAYTPTGPDLSELIDRIRSRRNHARAA